MAVCKDLPNFILNVAEAETDVFRLLKEIKPEWDKKQVTIKVLSGGFSCCMLRCSHESGECITVRVRSNLEGLMNNPLHERQVVKALSSKGEFPPVLATFENGFCYEYIPGTPLFVKDSGRFDMDDNKLRLVAEKMATIHMVVVPEFDYNQGTYFDFHMRLLSTTEPSFEADPNIDELKKELEIVREFASKTKSPLVLIHGDAHPGNFVLSEDQSKVVFVDWELTKVAPRGIDIAYFLNTVANFGTFYNLETTLPDNMERKFCEYYLQRWNELNHQPSPMPEDIEHLQLEVKHYGCAVQFSMIVLLLKLDDIATKFGDPEALFKDNLERYLTRKEAATGIKKFGPVPN